MTVNGSVRYVQRAPARLPDIQNVALRNPSAFDADRVMMRVTPSIIIETAMSDSQSLVMFIHPRTRDTTYTKTVVIVEPINALIESEYVPKNEKTPNNIPA
jgi:hypothetical protein